MFGLKNYQLLVVAIIIIGLFGLPKLPDVARSLGRSLRIVRDETKGLVKDDDAKDDDKASGKE